MYITYNNYIDLSTIDFLGSRPPATARPWPGAKKIDLHSSHLYTIETFGLMLKWGTFLKWWIKSP